MVIDTLMSIEESIPKLKICFFGTLVLSDQSSF